MFQKAQRDLRCKADSIIARQAIQLTGDKRFIQPQNVMEHLDDSANLAAMDWEDFEHLIRQVFEKEFSSEGGEVKITQASRDGGVDAIF